MCRTVQMLTENTDATTPTENASVPPESTTTAAVTVHAADAAAPAEIPPMTTAAPAHKTKRWERTLASEPAGPAERFEARLVRWRRLGKNLVFLDILKTGEADEWQLACAAEIFPPAKERADVIRVEARDEAGASRRGLRALRCDALEVVTERASTSKPAKNPDTRAKRDVLCKVWARGETCEAKDCAYRHEFVDPYEETWGRRLRARRDRDRRTDAKDPYAAFDKRADRNDWRFVPGDDNRKRRHAARHIEFGAWILAKFGRAALEAGPVLDVAGGKGELAWELQCVHGVRAVSLDPRAAKLPRKSRRKLLRKRLAALTAAASPQERLMARSPERVEALLDAAFEASPEGRALLESCSVIVALHADEATEAACDAALKYGKPFAIVPCCVFPDLFPNRPAEVRTTPEFCDYLAAKSGASLDFLRFEGKNKVVVRTAAAPRRADVVITGPCDSAHITTGLKTELMHERMRREHEAG